MSGHATSDRTAESMQSSGWCSEAVFQI